MRELLIDLLSAELSLVELVADLRSDGITLGGPGSQLRLDLRVKGRQIYGEFR